MPLDESTGDWNSAMNWISRVIEHSSNVGNKTTKSYSGSATKLPTTI